MIQKILGLPVPLIKKASVSELKIGFIRDLRPALAGRIFYVKNCRIRVINLIAFFSKNVMI